jgi:DNA-binding FadR family transcriptional regulator
MSRLSLTKRQPVQQVAEALRERIFALPPGEQIGSLGDLARDLGVGIVTVQQAARILEHEGLLDVRRGPGGGYFGRRPDLASLERAISAYWRSEPASLAEVLDMTSLLFNELCAAAARCDDPARHDELRRIAARIAACERDAEIGALEEALQDQLFRMVNRPFFQLITHIALRMATSELGHSGGLAIDFGLERWRESRRVIVDAILRRDPELAHFEANRRNRAVVMDGPSPPV